MSHPRFVTVSSIGAIAYQALHNLKADEGTMISQPARWLVQRCCFAIRTVLKPQALVQKVAGDESPPLADPVNLTGRPPLRLAPRLYGHRLAQSIFTFGESLTFRLALDTNNPPARASEKHVEPSPPVRSIDWAKLLTHECSRSGPSKGRRDKNDVALVALNVLEVLYEERPAGLFVALQEV